MEDYNQQEEQTSKKSIKGYKIVIIILAVILGAISYQYFRQVNSMKKEFAIERDTLANRLTGIMNDLDNLKTENDTISRNLGVERGKADSLMERLQKERNLNRATIRKYEKEVGTLRTVMQRYVRQLDSLNQLNQTLVAENLTYRKEVTSQRLRADAAEEKAQELSTKIRRGSVIRAREINILAMNQEDRVVSRASRAERLRIDFILSANELATPGERRVYVRITGPDGYIMADDANAVFDYEGDMLTYSASREIDYQNEDLAVSLYYNGSGIVAGTYKVAIYMDGYLVGETEKLLR